MMKKISYIIFILILVSGKAIAQPDYGIPDKPTPERLVNDFADVLLPADEAELEKILTDYSNATTTQIVILTVNTIPGDISQFAFDVFDKWGIGQSKKDNGLLIVVKKKDKEAGERGEVFINTGRGLEGAITDVQAKRIVEDDMIPHFKEGDYFNGILSGVNKCMELAGLDFPKQDLRSTGGGKFKSILAVLFILAFWIFMSSRKVRSYAGKNRLPWWTAFFMMNSMGRSHRGSWGNFTSGGGGFGGFGGGSTGGGGAGGSW
jgi:uncharacterized protein